MAIKNKMIYDPRDNKEKNTDNPALFLCYVAEEIDKERGYGLENDFYLDIINLANYCEEEIDA